MFNDNQGKPQKYKETNVKSEDIVFKEGNIIEIYFPDERVDYRFIISTTSFENYEHCVVATIPEEFIKTFYKGEDFIQCKYVEDNVVYQFGGEIMKIVYGKQNFVIIKKPTNLKKDNKRVRDRFSTNILSEYHVEKASPSEHITRMNGFASIKDVSAGGISFQTSDIIPNNTVLLLDLFKLGILVRVEVRKAQKINNKNFYGTKILSFDKNTEAGYKKLLISLATNDANVFIGELY